ncbi:MAG TPA: hypothetical protein VN828_09540, partial [Acidobacteriaceae bacterium]|nr:hypothetical protein [Acidobacteriaceae bacterium]
MMAKLGDLSNRLQANFKSAGIGSRPSWFQQNNGSVPLTSMQCAAIRVARWLKKHELASGILCGLSKTEVLCPKANTKSKNFNVPTSIT